MIFLTKELFYCPKVSIMRARNSVTYHTYFSPIINDGCMTLLGHYKTMRLRTNSALDNKSNVRSKKGPRFIGSRSQDWSRPLKPDYTIIR